MKNLDEKRLYSCIAIVTLIMLIMAPRAVQWNPVRTFVTTLDILGLYYDKNESSSKDLLVLQFKKNK
jgi:hypothetical protein